MSPIDSRPAKIRDLLQNVSVIAQSSRTEKQNVPEICRN